MRAREIWTRGQYSVSAARATIFFSFIIIIIKIKEIRTTAMFTTIGEQAVSLRVSSLNRRRVRPTGVLRRKYY